MDFTLGEDAAAIVGLATQILGERSTQAHLDALDAAGTWVDAELWAQLAGAGVVGASLAEDVGGGGLGFLELALVLEQVGAHVAQVPLLEAVAAAALPLDAFGTPEQRTRDLADVAGGRALLTAALVETGRDDVRRPSTVADPDGTAYRLSGTKTMVPLAEQARRVLVPAAGPEGRVVLVWLEPSAAGVTLRPQVSTHGQPAAELVLDGVRVAAVDVLAGPERGDEVLGWLHDRVLAGVAATALGVSGRALRMSAQYTSAREQFGRPIATFQAVGHRLADAYIDVEAMRLTTLQAAWRLGAGLPATEAVAIAKWWAADGGHRVAHAAQHVHGGVGIDVDYALHRFFTWSKHLEFALGGATTHLLRLGAALAAEPA